MNLLLSTFRRRLGAILLVAIGLTTPNGLLPGGLRLLTLLVVLLIATVGAAWSVRDLQSRRARIGGGILVFFVTMLLSLAVSYSSDRLSCYYLESLYQAQGIKLQHGCNLLASSIAEVDVGVLEADIRYQNVSTPADRQRLLRLEQGYATKNKFLQLLKRDIRIRGHRDTVPTLPEAGRSDELGSDIP